MITNFFCLFIFVTFAAKSQFIKEKTIAIQREIKLMLCVINAEKATINNKGNQILIAIINHLFVTLLRKKLKSLLIIYYDLGKELSNLFVSFKLVSNILMRTHIDKSYIDFMNQKHL